MIHDDETKGRPVNTLGTSGTRAMIHPEVARWEANGLGGFDGYVTGGCQGWDEHIGRAFVDLYPDAIHTVVVPANRSQVAEWWQAYPQVVVIEMPEGTSYKDRNKEIVVRSDVLYYCAEYPEAHGKSRRSGTWQTVRLARAKGIPIKGTILMDTT